MKKFMTVSLAAGLLAICTSALRADDTTNSPATSAPTTTTTPSVPKKALDPEKRALQRRELMSILGLTRAELKGLTTEDRNAKIKTLADKKITELEAKQTAGSITSKEQSNLALLKKFEHRAHAKPKTES